MHILILIQWATIITVRQMIASMFLSHPTFQVMSTTVDTEDTMVVVGTADIMVGTIMRVMEVIIMGVTGVTMEEVEDMVDTMEVDMEDTMAVDMVDTVAVATAADTTEGTDTILVVLVLAMVTDTH